MKNVFIFFNPIFSIFPVLHHHQQLYSSLGLPYFPYLQQLYYFKWGIFSYIKSVPTVKCLCTFCVSSRYIYYFCKQNKIFKLYTPVQLMIFCWSKKNYFLHMRLEFFPLRSCYILLCMKKIVTSLSSSPSLSSSRHYSNNIYKFDDDGCSDGWWMYEVWWDVTSIV